MKTYCMTEDGRVYGQRDEFHGHLSGGCHPVVVISPEDREQVERFEDVVANRMGWVNTSNHPIKLQRANGFQAALREFATPKPEVYEHIAIEADGTHRALCGKVWKPSDAELVVGRCPNCRDIIDSKGWLQ